MNTRPVRLTSLAVAVLIFACPLFGQNLALIKIAEGVEMPVGIVHASDSRLFIVNQTGRLSILDAGQILEKPFLNISDEVLCCEEQGMLGLAFHPQYPQNGRFFISYVDHEGDLVIAEYAVSENREVADPDSRAVLLTIEHRASVSHYSGQLAFGPDGYLYIGTGDGQWPRDPQSEAQNLHSLLGKILRIDVDHLPNLIPPTNPFVPGIEARGEIWAFGLRNPWRFSFDRATGDLWIADVGENVWEELNFQPAASRGGENYGWPQAEGMECAEDSPSCWSSNGVTAPVLTYEHSEGRCSIIGGYRYRGASEEMQGMYVYGDFCTGDLWAARQLDDGTWAPRLLMRTGLLLTTFGEDEAGELYVADWRGGIFKLRADRAPKRRPLVTPRIP